MADEEKGVVVYVHHTRRRDVYASATNIHVIDGHLHVYKGDPALADSETVAIYAPDKWLHAKVTS